MATHVELNTTLRMLLGNPTVANVAESILTTFNNQAYMQISSRYRFHATRVWTVVDTVAGTGVYTLNANDVEVLQVWNKTNGGKLSKIDADNLYRYDDSVAYPTNRGIPRKYVRKGNTIVVYPTPDAVYKVEILTKRLPVALNLTTDVPVLPATWHDAIPLWARWQYFDSRGDYPKAQYAYNSLQQWLQTKPNEYDEENAAFDHSVDIPTLANGVYPARDRNFDTSED